MPSARHLIFDAELRLEFFDPAAFEAHLGRLRAGSLEFTTLAAELAGRGPEALGEIYALHMECRRRQPPVETRTRPIDPGLWRRDFAGPGELALPEGLVLARQGGGWVGLSALVRVPQDDTRLESGFTGVRPAFTGRGVALALKAVALGWARRQGYRAVTTAVLDSNLPMRRVNAALGFVETGSRARVFSW